MPKAMGRNVFLCKCRMAVLFMKQKRILTEDVLKAFAFRTDASFRPFGGGHINEKFLVESPEKTQILQRINRSVLP